MDLETLVELAAVEGERSAGTPLTWLAARHDPRLVLAAGNGHNGTHRPPAWSAAEDAFLREHLGYLTEEDIALALGRSPNAVHLRWDRDLNLPAPSKHPDWLTGQEVARRLGIDVHQVCSLIERNLLPARITPGERAIRLVRRVTFYRWGVNPDNWIYFKPWRGRVTDWKLARLIELKRKRWGDEWWTPGQVADYHGVHHTDVNRYIRAGKLAGVQYGNWWILRSEATRPGLVFHRGTGSGHELDWSPAADRFLLRARRRGVSYAAIARLMKWPERRVGYRYRVLTKGK